MFWVIRVGDYFRQHLQCVWVLKWDLIAADVQLAAASDVAAVALVAAVVATVATSLCCSRLTWDGMETDERNQQDTAS